MNWFDLLLAAVFLYHLASGFSRGFVKQLFDVLGVFLVVLFSFWGSRFFSAELAVFINPEDLIPHHDLIQGLGFDLAMERVPQLVAGVILFLVFLLALSLIFRLLSRGFKWVNKVPLVGFFNRLGGALLGVLIGALLIYIIIAALDLLPLKPVMHALEGSEVVFVTKYYLTPLALRAKEFLAHYYISSKV